MLQACSSCYYWLDSTINYSDILETYTLSELIELNDLSEEDVLEVLVEAGVVELPEILPLEFNETSK